MLLRTAVVLFLLLGGDGVAGLPSSFSAEAAESEVRIGLTPVFLDERSAFLKRWRTYLEERIGRPVRFVQKRTYREVVELLLDEKLDAAWICGFPYVRSRHRLRLLAVPVFRGQPLYQSYLIVSRDDQETTDIASLQGRVFAYSDPDSNSGYLVPRVDLLRSGFDPENFFARTFFAWAHHDVVKAVAVGLADGGAVDGYVWETINLTQPELTERTRIVSKSEKFGFPPMVASGSISSTLLAALRAVMTEMDDNETGQALLEELNLDGFVSGQEALFDGIRDSVDYYDQHL